MLWTLYVNRHTSVSGSCAVQMPEVSLRPVRLSMKTKSYRGRADASPSPFARSRSDSAARSLEMQPARMRLRNAPPPRFS